MRHFLSLLLMTIPGIVFFTLLFAVSFLETAFPILFYRGLLLAAITFAIQFAGLHFLYRKTAIEMKISAATLAASLNVCFLVIFPVTIERSVSIYLLGQIERSENGITEEALERRFIQRYVQEFGAIARRINEQETSGNVRTHNGRVYISDQGRAFLDFSRFVGKLFATNLTLLSDSTAAYIIQPADSTATNGIPIDETPTDR